MSDLNLFIQEVTDDDNMKPKDFRGIIAVDDSGEAWVLATTKDCKDCDLFFDRNLLSDYGSNITSKMNVGLYSCSFHPWSYQTYEGDYDCGIDVKDIKLIASAPEEFLMMEIDNGK